MDVEVAPGVFVSEEEVEAEQQGDAMREDQAFDEERERETEERHEHFTDAKNGVI